MQMKWWNLHVCKWAALFLNVFFYRVITRRSEWNDFRPDGTSQARAAEAKRIGSLVFRRSFAYMQMRPMKNVWNLRRSPAVFCSGHMEMVIYDNFLRFKPSISARNLHMQMRANVKIGRKFLKKVWKILKNKFVIGIRGSHASSNEEMFCLKLRKESGNVRATAGRSLSPAPTWNGAFRDEYIFLFVFFSSTQATDNFIKFREMLQHFSNYNFLFQIVGIFCSLKIV